MAESKDRDWIDISAKLMLPVVLAIGGGIYTFGRDTQADKQRQWERDSGFMRMLASSNADEREMGLKMIGVLQDEGKFSADLRPLVKAVRNNRRPSDPTTQLANTILNKDGGRTVTPIPSATSTKQPAREVYIQIGHEDQRQRATELQATLQQSGFLVPGIELVPHPTFHTYIRYFDTAGLSEADKIDALMKLRGFQPTIQDFSKSASSGSNALEIWFGDKESDKASGALK
jgi:hypothetical protein